MYIFLTAEQLKIKLPEVLPLKQKTWIAAARADVDAEVTIKLKSKASSANDFLITR